MSPFDADELSKILELINQLKGGMTSFTFIFNDLKCYYISPDSAVDDDSPENAQLDNDFLHSACVIGKRSYTSRSITINQFINSEVHALLQYVYSLRHFSAWLIHSEGKAKFVNFCGLPCARLDADKSVYADATNLHPLIRSLSLALDVVLFLAPRARLKDLRRVWVDESIVMPRWKDFNRNLMAEWTGITIYVCVVESSVSHFVTYPALFPPVHRHVSRRCKFACDTNHDRPVTVDRGHCHLSLNYLHHRILDHLTPAGASEPTIWF